MWSRPDWPLRGHDWPGRRGTRVLGDYYWTSSLGGWPASGECESEGGEGGESKASDSDLVH